MLRALQSTVIKFFKIEVLERLIKVLLAACDSAEQLIQFLYYLESVADTYRAHVFLFLI